MIYFIGLLFHYAPAVDQLDSLQQQLKDCLYGCQQRLFQRFYNNHYDACLFTLAALAEIDVLSSFAVIALPGVTLFGASSVPTREAMCRPHFVDCKVGSQTEQPYDSVDASIDSQSDGVLSESDSRPILRLINSRHPIVAAALPVSSGEYVPNDIRLGDPDDPAGLSQIDSNFVSSIWPWPRNTQTGFRS